VAIVFHHIRYKNFLSTGNAFTELELDKSSTTLIIGENGAGKSTILDALSFVLFNKPFRKVNKGQLINSITRKDLQVEVEFTIGQNRYHVIRGVKPNLFEVYMNGKLLNQSSDVRDYQEILEKQILKINHKSFCQVVVLGSASFVPFMQLPTGQRREIIEDLLDLQIFTTMNMILKQKAAENVNDIWKAEKDKDLVEEKIKLVREHMAEIQKNSEKLIKEKKERLKSTDFEISKFIEKKFEIDRDIEKLSEKILDEDAMSKRVNKVSKLKHQLEAKIANLNNDIEFLNNHENCPTCQRNIDEGFKAESIDKKNENIAEVSAGLSQLTAEYDKVNSRISEIMEIHSDINAKRMELHRVLTKISSLEEYKAQIQEEIDSIKVTEKDKDTSKLDELVLDLENSKQLIVRLSEDQVLYQAAGVLLKDGGIKSRIIKQYIPIINKLISKYLSAMDFFVQFELDENFNETIKSRYRDEFSYASFSEGEKMRINLAVLFTWRAVAKLRNSVNTNILIMDEVFDSSLDASGTEEFMKILNQLTNDANVYIISHKTDQIVDKFDNVIRFEKHKNFSKMVA
jgi:DNA repair exonuclease SbcCD ATPase subunit